MNYLIGDLQGCCDALDRLLAEIGFSPSRDRLYVLGDLVNRGPQSLATLRRLRGLGARRDLPARQPRPAPAGRRRTACAPRHRSDTLDDILDAPDRDAWLDWLRQRRMAVFEHGWLMVHAGVVPQWDLATDAGARRARSRRCCASAPPRDFLARDVRQRAGALERRARRRRRACASSSTC